MLSQLPEGDVRPARQLCGKAVAQDAGKPDLPNGQRSGREADWIAAAAQHGCCITPSLHQSLTHGSALNTWHIFGRTLEQEMAPKQQPRKGTANQGTTNLDCAAGQAGPAEGGGARVCWEQRAIHIKQQRRWALRRHGSRWSAGSGVGAGAAAKLNVAAPGFRRWTL